MLTAALAASLLIASGSTAAPSKLAPIFAVEEWGTTTGQFSILRLDPTTLAETGRTELGESRSLGPHAFSPDRSKLAITGERGLWLLDTRLSRLIGPPMPIPPVAALAWPSPRLVLALTSTGERLQIDPTVPRVLSASPGSRLTWPRPAKGRIVGVVGPVIAGPRRTFGAPLRVRILSGSRDITVRAARIRVALEDWRARPGATLPPLAERAVALARADLAGREGFGVNEVEALRVIPSLFTAGFTAAAAYEVDLGARGRHFRYRAYMNDERTQVWAYFDSELSAAPDRTENDILGASVGTWHVSDVRLVVDSPHDRLFVLTPASVFVEADLRSARIRVRPLKGPLGSLGWRPAFLGADRIAVPTSPLKLLDVRAGRAWPISPHRSAGTYIEPAGTRFVVHEAGGRGIEVYDRRGRVQRLLGRYTVWDVEAAGSRAFVTTFDGNRYEFAVVDLARGRVLRTVPKPRLLDLLVGRR